MSPPAPTAVSQCPSSTERSASTQAGTPPRSQNAVPVSVLKRSPPPVSASQTRKGATRRPKEERQGEVNDEDEEEVEVVEVKRTKDKEDVEALCPQSFSNKSAKEMEVPKEEEVEVEEEEEDDDDDDEDNGVVEVDDESGTEDKEKDLLR